MTDERRKHPRFDLEFTVQAISSRGDTVITALTTNISDGGFCIPMPAELLPDAGQPMNIRLNVLQAATGKAKTYTGTSRIIRRGEADEDGMAEVAMEFTKPLELQLEDKTSYEPRL
ncbi:MAG: PilZ domain-containing protein [Phycisphaerae bacterium]|nr:PilZ domain-containing protein [Phycisphaerae bacterium]